MSKEDLMARKPAVICLYCNKSFHREDEEYGQEGRRYFHKRCGDKVKKLQEFLAEKLGDFYSPTKIKNQINKITKDGYSLDDICDTMYWWYEIKKSDPSKSNGGIGIFSYVYGDYINYKNHQEKVANLNKDKDIEDYISDDSIKITIHRTPIKKPKKLNLFNLS